MEGKKVLFEYFFMAGEQGQRDQSEWMDTKVGEIVEEKGDKALIETKNGSRQWVEKKHIHDLDWKYEWKPPEEQPKPPR